MIDRILVTVAYADLEDGKRVSQTKMNRLPLILLESLHKLTSLSHNTLKDLPSDFNSGTQFHQIGPKYLSGQPCSPLSSAFTPPSR